MSSALHRRGSDFQLYRDAIDCQGSMERQGIVRPEPPHLGSASRG